jgi:hypothetical protein
MDPKGAEEIDDDDYKACKNSMSICNVVPASGGAVRDENGSDTDGYHRYYICFHISGRIQIRIRIVSAMPDRIRFDVDIINMRFEFSDADIESDVKYPDSNTDRSEPL